jgi:hypothetical protein
MSGADVVVFVDKFCSHEVQCARIVNKVMYFVCPSNQLSQLCTTLDMQVPDDAVVASFADLVDLLVKRRYDQSWTKWLRKGILRAHHVSTQVRDQIGYMPTLYNAVVGAGMVIGMAATYAAHQVIVRHGGLAQVTANARQRLVGVSSNVSTQRDTILIDTSMYIPKHLSFHTGSLQGSHK